MGYEPTSDHDEIRLWAKQHGANPAERLPERVDGLEPVLTFIFHRISETSDKVIPISWTDFFDRFDRLGLSFMGTAASDEVSREYLILYDAAEATGLRFISHPKRMFE